VARANDAGWPKFDGRYVTYPRFKRDWLAYVESYHVHAKREILVRSLKEISLSASARMAVLGTEDLEDIWKTLDVHFNRARSYAQEALEPVLQFKKYKQGDTTAVRDLYSTLRSVIRAAKEAGYLQKVITDESVPRILARLPSSDWRQWGKEDVHRDPENISAEFEKFVEVKWLDAISVACWDPTSGSGEAQAPDQARRTGAAPG
jgi:hypothetical protein